MLNFELSSANYREVTLIILGIVFALGILISAANALGSSEKPPLLIRMMLPGPYMHLRKLAEENKLLKEKLLESGLFTSTQTDSEAPKSQSDNSSLSADVTGEVRVLQNHIESRYLSPANSAKLLLINSLDNNKADLKPEEALRLYQTIADQQNRLEERGNLRETTASQLGSTASTKTSMISLFVMFNLGVIAAFIFSPTTVASAKELILGLYISLATFIVYVYRAANARALVLLAITEDMKRYHDAEKYLNHLRPNAAPSKRDLDILRLILTNRAEREKHNEHPYELVLKGVSNSNILLKGGKVMPTVGRKSATKTKDSEE